MCALLWVQDLKGVFSHDAVENSKLGGGNSYSVREEARRIAKYGRCAMPPAAVAVAC
jgi:hypothetical protein